MSPLNKKLLRDLWRIKGQAVVIALVISVGVMLLVMMDGLVNSLTETKNTYYERYRFADVFAPLKRAPQNLLNEIVQLPGVATVEGRVIGGALVDLPGTTVPIMAQAVSLPDFGSPQLNDIYLVAGRRPSAEHADEILLLRAFAEAHQLVPGDFLTATMNGARRRFTIVGLAQAPEFLYATAPGELAPSDERFAVLWLSETALAAAFDMDGAFNEVLVSLARNAQATQVIDELDRLLAAYGGLGAYGRDGHLSNRFVDEEVSGLEAMSTGVPPIFLGVAAFLLYIVISRMVQAEREQIGLLKAFGYSSWEIGTHYGKFVLLIAISGALAGCAFGVLAGRALAGFYQLYFKFPFLAFILDPSTFVLGFVVSVGAASFGGFVVLREVFSLTPAVAMRPPTPADYSHSLSFSERWKKVLDQPSRIVLRGLIRKPGRAVAAIIGIAAGMALSVAMASLMSGFDKALQWNYDIIDRSDVTVSLIEPLGDKTIFELQRIPGVLSVEPFRAVSAVLRNGLYSHRGAVSGSIPEPRLLRAVDADLRAIYIRNDGIILAQGLADILKIKPGELLSLEVNEGRRPHLQVPVVGVANALLGAPAYMDLTELNRLLKEPGRVSGAYLKIDSVQSPTIYQQLKAMPAVAGVSLREESRLAFEKMMDTGAGAMRYIMAAIAGVISFGIVYNSARITFAESARDLASLRVLGLTRNEVAFILLGDLGLMTLMAIPIGSIAGYYLSQLLAAGFSTELYQIPAFYSPVSYGTATLAVLAAALISGWLVKRDLDNLDLVSTLKTRE